jgi:hypothetical protein
MLLGGAGNCAQGNVDAAHGFGKAYTRTARSTRTNNRLTVAQQLRYQLI